VCGTHPLGGDHGCGLYFCEEHFISRQPRGSDDYVQLCPRCAAYRDPYKHIAPEHPTWMRHKLRDASWLEWRKENPKEVEAIRAQLRAIAEHEKRQVPHVA
jgi:hypothetical protein